MERRNAEDWDGIKLETLAREYMEVRREMWEILGRRVNEKWQIVEAKVCASPIYNLQWIESSSPSSAPSRATADSNLTVHGEGPEESAIRLPIRGTQKPRYERPQR